MNRFSFWILAGLLGWGNSGHSAEPAPLPLAHRPWFEARTAHFSVYFCAAPQEVYMLAGRLEQFCETYSALAGADAVASPPIVVMALPDHQSLRPFLPLYRGQPANLAAFFKRGSDENLIVLALPPANSAFTDMEVIFHEYTHLLLRRNGRIWPLWLNEGMAEIYSTFESMGRQARIAKPIEPHLALLARQPLMPLSALFAVNHDSPQYNESERQGIFYAESWLLTHFLIAGDHPAYKTGLGQFTQLLRDGQPPIVAFTNALRTSLPVLEAQLRLYLRNGKFTPIDLVMRSSLTSPRILSTRALTPVEAYFRLGDELLRIDRFDAAESYFTSARKVAPASPLPYEGLGLLAAARENHEDAIRELAQALQRGSTSFLAHYIHAREGYRLTADSQGRHSALDPEKAAEIRAEIQKALALMPDFGPAHELLGFFEMVQREDLSAAEQHLQRAIQLEPENDSYLISMAQVQLAKNDPIAARNTLSPLLRPTADPNLRKPAEELIHQIEQSNP